MSHLERSLSVKRYPSKAAKALARAAFDSVDLSEVMAYDEDEALEMRERFACSRERDIYNDERAQSIFKMSAANPNDYL